MPKRIAVVMALMMMSAAVFAQAGASGNAFVGYSFNRAGTSFSNTGNLNGWEVSAEGKVAPFAGFVADVGAQYGTLQTPASKIFGGPGTIGTTSRVVTYMFGPRISASVGRFRPFAQAFVGAGHLHQSTIEYTYGETCIADALGGGVDYRIIPLIAWRVQGDYLQTRFHGTRQDDTRVSTGLVVRF